MKKPIQLITNAVTGDMVRKEEFQGEMHYMIRSATMPDDIVMNGILYPAEEIEKTYMTLNEVHAPIGHPVDDGGMFVSATSPFAIRNYYVGAQVVNVKRENGKVYHDTAINISAAKQSDRGKRLLDRVEALMNGDNPKPIHTSTGVYLNKKDLEQPMTNQYGEYKAIASDLYYDHNAILLDEEGAATPEQGTGMAVNHKDQEVFVHNFEGEVVAESSDDKLDEMYALKDAIRDKIREVAFTGEKFHAYICELHDQYVIAEIFDRTTDKDESYKIPYMIDGDSITLGQPQKVKRNVVYTAINSLATFIKSIGFASSNHEAYNGDVNNQTTDEVEQMEKQEMLDVLAEALKPLQANHDALAEKIDAVAKTAESLQANSLNAEKAEKEALIAKSGLDAEIAETMSVNALKAVVAKLESADAGEFGERVGELAGNKKKTDEWEGYDLNANLEAK